MGFRFGRVVPVAFALVAALVGCGGGSSGGPSLSITPTPTPKPSGAAPTLTPTPSPTPTQAGVACSTSVDPLPGTYVVIFTSGNVVGKTYTQNSAPGSGTWNAAAYSATPTPMPTPTPSENAIAEPTSPIGTSKRKPTPTPTPTPSPTTTPTTGPTAPPFYIAYSGAYSVAGFSGTSSNGAYTVSPTTGCIVLLATLSGKPISPGGNFNASGKGGPLFNTYLGVGSIPVASGNILTFTIGGLGPSSGSGTFTLDNNADGTVAIQSSQVVSMDRARRILERIQRYPGLGFGDMR